MSTAMSEWPRRHKITVEHFYRMGEAGVFDGAERVELVNGEVIDTPPMGSRHASVVDRLVSELFVAIAGRAFVRSQLPVRLGADSEPLPDVAVVRPRADRYADSHPTGADVLLAVEVSDSTVRYDREVKAPLYGRSAIPETWVIDLTAGRVHVYRAPQGGAYTQIETHELGRLALAAFPEVVVDLAAAR